MMWYEGARQSADDERARTEHRTSECIPARGKDGMACFGRILTHNAHASLAKHKELARMDLSFTNLTQTPRVHMGPDSCTMRFAGPQQMQHSWILTTMSHLQVHTYTLTNTHIHTCTHTHLHTRTFVHARTHRHTKFLPKHTCAHFYTDIPACLGPRTRLSLGLHLCSMLCGAHVRLKLQAHVGTHGHVHTPWPGAWDVLSAHMH